MCFRRTGSLFKHEYRRSLCRHPTGHHLEHLNVFTMMRSQLEEVSLAGSQTRQQPPSWCWSERTAVYLTASPGRSSVHPISAGSRKLSAWSLCFNRLPLARRQATSLPKLCQNFVKLRIASQSGDPTTRTRRDPRRKAEVDGR